MGGTSGQLSATRYSLIAEDFQSFVRITFVPIFTISVAISTAQRYD
jgi:hypothetical protein